MGGSCGTAWTSTISTSISHAADPIKHVQIQGWHLVGLTDFSDSHSNRPLTAYCDHCQN